MKKLALLLALLLVAGNGLWQASQRHRTRHRNRRPRLPGERRARSAGADSRRTPGADERRASGAVATAVPPASVVRSEPIQPARRKLSVNDVVLPGNRIYDAEFGLSAIYPDGWGVAMWRCAWGETRAKTRSS